MQRLVQVNHAGKVPNDRVHQTLDVASDDLAGDPALELLRPRQLTGKNEAVQAGLVDDGHSPGGVKTVVLAVLLILCLNVLFQRAKAIGIPQRLRYVLADKPRFVVNLNCSHLTEGRVLKYFQFVHNSLPLFCFFLSRFLCDDRIRLKGRDFCVK